MVPASTDSDSGVLTTDSMDLTCSELDEFSVIVYISFTNQHIM